MTVTASSASPGPAFAQLAREAVAETAGVALSAAPGPASPTSAGERRIDGLTCVADDDDRYALGLQLVVGWPAPPLRELADELRGRLRAGAARRGLADRLGGVEIDVVAVVEAAPS